MSAIWEIYALKYAERNTRTRAESFISDPHHNAQHDMDYFVWLLRSGDQNILVDTGYDRSEGQRRDRPILTPPEDMLRQMGVEPDSIATTILTHLHYDHAGSLTVFPNTKLHVQEREMAFATGPCMCHDHIRAPFTGDHICDMVRALYAGRVTFANGSSTVADGVETHLIGGHSRGLQCVRVRTQRGWVVLASDASHYYENYLAGKPFPIVVDMEDMLAGFKTLRRLVDTADHIIPGHDPLVRSLYPALNGIDGIHCLHEAPAKSVMQL